MRLLQMHYTGITVYPVGVFWLGAQCRPTATTYFYLPGGATSAKSRFSLISNFQRLRFGGSLADIVRSTNLLTYLLTYLKGWGWVGKGMRLTLSWPMEANGGQGPRPCSREGARGEGMTDRHRDDDRRFNSLYDDDWAD